MPKSITKHNLLLLFGFFIVAVLFSVANAQAQTTYNDFCRNLRKEVSGRIPCSNIDTTKGAADADALRSCLENARQSQGTEAAKQSSCDKCECRRDYTQTSCTITPTGETRASNRLNLTQCHYDRNKREWTGNATCSLTLIYDATITCTRPQEPQVGAAPTAQRPTLFQRLFGRQEVVSVELKQTFPQTFSTTYTHRGDEPPPPASNQTNQSQNFTADVYKDGTHTLTGLGVIPANTEKAQVKLVNGKLSPDAIVTYRMVDGANGQAGFVTANLVETYEKLLKGLFGDNNGTTMEIKTPKKGLQFTYSITSQDPNEPLNVTFDGKKQKVREIKESISVDTLTTNYNLTFDGLSVLRGGDEVAKVLALLFSGGASLLVQWIPAPEKSQEPTTGGTSGGGTSGGEPPTGGVPPRGRCRPSELGGSDLERTWRQRGHDLISSCSWVNSGHDLEGSFNTETWGPGHNFGQSKLSAPDGWSPVD